MLLKPSLLGRILDDFWGVFLLLFNLGFSFIFHFVRYLLGTIINHRMSNVHIWVGKMFPIDGTGTLFWPVFCGITLGISIASSIVIIGKSISFHLKEKSMVQQIQLGQTNRRHFNTSEYNKPLWKPPILVGLAAFFASVTSISRFLIFSNDDLLSLYQYNLYFFVVGSICHKVFFPVIVLVINPNMRQFMYNAISKVKVLYSLIKRV